MIVLKCPFCLKEIKYREKEIELPYIGKSLIISYICESCGYKTSTIEILEKKEPIRYKVKIKSREDLRIKIVRSKYGKIIVPEIGVEIIPGPDAEMFITNVEGLLNRIKDKVEMSMRFNQDNESALERGKEVLQYIADVIDGKREITIIIEDVTGTSKIVGENVEVEKYEGSDI